MVPTSQLMAMASSGDLDSFCDPAVRQLLPEYVATMRDPVEREVLIFELSSCLFSQKFFADLDILSRQDGNISNSVPASNLDLEKKENSKNIGKQLSVAPSFGFALKCRYSFYKNYSTSYRIALTTVFHVPELTAAHSVRNCSSHGHSHAKFVYISRPSSL